MARWELVDDELWELVKSLLPDRTPQRTGRRRVSDRAAFTAIVFVLRIGVPWRLVPRQIEGGLTGPSPVDRARTGSKHHLLVDAAGVPLAVALTSGTSPLAHPLNPYWDAATKRRGQAA